MDEKKRYSVEVMRQGARLNDTCIPIAEQAGLIHRKEGEHMDFKSLPKIELHLHLDCSLSYTVVQAIDPSITQEEYEHNFVAPAKCTNLADFLTRAPKSIALMQTVKQLRLVTFDVFEQLQRDNVLYAEIRFAPLLHTKKQLS